MYIVPHDAIFVSDDPDKALTPQHLSDICTVSCVDLMTQDDTPMLVTSQTATSQAEESEVCNVVWNDDIDDSESADDDSCVNDDEEEADDAWLDDEVCSVIDDAEDEIFVSTIEDSDAPPVSKGKRETIATDDRC